MPAERAGYTVTMFLVDVSPSMGKVRSVQLPDDPDGQEHSIEMTNLEWSLQFVMLKIQEMIFNGRKTEQCGVILFGTDETHNVVNDKTGDYEYVTEYIPICQPNASTLSKLAALTPSETIGDPIDALVVGIETQHNYLASKKTWTRKMVLLTDGENPIEVEDWETIVEKMKALDILLTVVGIDFDDEEIEFREDDKSHVKNANEAFFHTFTEALDTSVIGTLSYALQEVTKPDIKQTKSALLGNTLRLGNPDDNPHEALEISVKTSKCTARAHPKSWKRFGLRKEREGTDVVPTQTAKGENVWAQLNMRTEYVLPKAESDEDEDEKREEEDDKMDVDGGIRPGERLEKETLVRGYKYGSSYAPCPEGQFPRLNTKKGIEICGFFDRKRFRREHAMGEIHYVWADPISPNHQVMLSSLVQAMEGEEVQEGEEDKGRMAVARWVSRDGADPKMGVLAPCRFEKVDCLLWVPMPFADDVRRYNFSPLENLFNKRGERVTEHPYIPTGEQMRAMDKFVDAMDLMEAGEKNEDGTREAWFDTRLSYNPAIHRVKQALFHGAVVQDLANNPLPPPHPEITKYFDPPKRVVKKAREAVEDCKAIFSVKEVPKRAPRARKDDHVRAQDDEDEALLLDRKPSSSQARSGSQLSRTQTLPRTNTLKLSTTRGSQHFSLNKKGNDSDDSATEPESDDDGENLLARKGPTAAAAATGKESLPSPTPSPEPNPGRAPGRIVGVTAPLTDFRQNVSRGDVVSKAVEDLGWAVKEIVMRPFASRRTGEMVECLKELRDVCLQEDEIAAWSRFLPELKAACLGDPGNEDFWREVRKEGPAMSLIGHSEAEKQGGSSDVSDKDAEKFLR
ncbi:SPOC domain-like protein [Amylostereum chailletii]|nr:SPOC domain-like protein [Amylostereum chailletii]